MIPEAAVEAAVKSWQALDGAPGSWTIQGNLRKVLEAAAPHMLPTSERVEIGYLCRRGHFIFHDDPDVDYACGSKRMAGIFVTPEEGVYPHMFTEALTEARADFGSALERAYK